MPKLTKRELCPADWYDLTLSSGKVLGIIQINGATLAVFDKETGEGSVFRTMPGKGVQATLEAKDAVELARHLQYSPLPDAVMCLVKAEADANASAEAEKPLTKEELRQFREMLAANKSLAGEFTMIHWPSHGYVLTRSASPPLHWDSVAGEWVERAAACWRGSPRAAAAGSGVTSWKEDKI